MNSFTHRLFLAACLATTMLQGCADNEAESPAPADPLPTYKMGHYFYYPASNSGGGVTHPIQDITGEARLFSQVLALDFMAAPDAPHFEIDRAQLKPDWVGAYTLRCRTRPNDPVFASYSYSNGSGSRIFRFSDFTQTLTGNVTITAYDARRQLVSGHFEVNAADQSDPAAASIDKKCNITLIGDFTDMKIKVQP